MRILFGTIWSLVFAAIGLGLGALIENRLVPAFQFTQGGLLPLAGLAIGLAAYHWFLQKNWLAGLHTRLAASGPSPRRWGLLQALWLVVGFLLLQGVGFFIIRLLGGLVVTAGFFADNAALSLGAVHFFLVFDIVGGYIAAALWCVWYIGRQGPEKRHDGSPTGIGWCPAPHQAYRLAAFLSAAIIGLVMVMTHVFPPDAEALKKLPMAQMLENSGTAAIMLLVLAVFIAPPVEEYVFRGGVFAALASRVSPLWAGLLTSVLFVAVHAPEKIHYPLGFLDVGLMALAAAWLRVRFSSIKPGILLHVLYNGGLMLAAGLAGGAGG